MQKALQDVTVLVQGAFDEQSQAKWDAMVLKICDAVERRDIETIGEYILKEVWPFVCTLEIHLDTREQVRVQINKMYANISS